MVQADRTTIVVDYEHDFFLGGDRSTGRNQVSLPSEHAIYTKAHTFSEKSEALYILLQSKALQKPRKKSEPIQVSSTIISTSPPALTEAFDEWLRAMRDDDSVALESIARKQTQVWDIAEAELLKQLRKDAKALEQYTDLDQFKIASIQKKKKWLTIRTPVIKHDGSPDGYYLIVFFDLEPPILRDGVKFVTTSGQEYLLHPQTLTRVYELHSSSESDVTDTFSAYAHEGLISSSDVKAFLDEIEALPSAKIEKRMFMLANSGDLGSIVSDELDLKLINTVLADRKRVSAGLEFKREYGGNSSTIKADIVLRSGEAIVLGGYTVGKGSKAYFVIQVEVLRLKSDLRGANLTASPEPSPGRRRVAEAQTILSTAYFCRVPKDGSLLRDFISQENESLMMFSDEQLKRLLKKIEDDPSAELVTSIVRRCKENELETMTCDAIQNVDVTLELTHHIPPSGKAIDSEVALKYTGTDSNQKRFSSETVTKVYCRENQAFAIRTTTDNPEQDLWVILHSKL